MPSKETLKNAPKPIKTCKRPALSPGIFTPCDRRECEGLARWRIAYPSRRIRKDKDWWRNRPTRASLRLHPWAGVVFSRHAWPKKPTDNSYIYPDHVHPEFRSVELAGRRKREPGHTAGLQDSPWASITWDAEHSSLSSWTGPAGCHAARPAHLSRLTPAALAGRYFPNPYAPRARCRRGR